MEHLALFMILAGGDYTSNPPGIGSKKMIDAFLFYKENRGGFKNVKKNQVPSVCDDVLTVSREKHWDIQLDKAGEIGCHIYLANLAKKDKYLVNTSMDMMYNNLIKVTKKRNTNFMKTTPKNQDFEEIYTYIRSKKSQTAASTMMLEYQHMIMNIKRSLWVINYYLGCECHTTMCCDYSLYPEGIADMKWGWAVVPKDIGPTNTEIDLSNIKDWIILKQPIKKGISLEFGEGYGTESAKSKILNAYKSTIISLFKLDTDYSKTIRSIENWKVVVYN